MTFMLNNLVKTTLGASLLAASAFASAAVIPYGPQNDVAVSTVTNDWGWSECYSATYATPMGTTVDDELANCSGDYLMLAARRTGSDVFEVLAAAGWDDVLTDTGAANNDVTTTANGAEWYYADGWSWGFAGLGDDVNKFECDTAAASERDRLCWHTLNGVGGYRAGSYLGLNNSTDWEKVILVANAVAVPAPATALLLGLSLAGLGLRRRNK
ncbi:PEP-CTERM sorting domain-containing protein [Corallincola luteus]|uniref:PEP-CTERM sorting domain-containing protein n=2 Tax=Corallincola luteus TaxID=1775177 RepID=A0ABY2AJD8_9GAMM|nr:PEP-CTERM sorting domain-containing protein [Corallincola luteus]